MERSPRLSLADAFEAALAKEKKAELVTGDPEINAGEGDQNPLAHLNR